MEDLPSRRARGRHRRLVPGAVRLLASLLVGHLAPALASAQVLGESFRDPPAPPHPPGFVGPVQGGWGPLDVFDTFMDEIPDDEEWYARHAGMLETESGWLVRAESPWAQGWAQFTPPTRGDWWPKVPGCAELVESDPFNQRCSVLAMSAYMEWLFMRSLRMVQDAQGALAMARRAYNGGLGWQIREHKLCLATPGCDPGNPDHMAALCREAGRSESACRENHSYAGKIAKAEPKYRERKKKRALRVLGRVAKAAARTAVAVSPSPVGLDDVRRARQGARIIRGR